MACGRGGQRGQHPGAHGFGAGVGGHQFLEPVTGGGFAGQTHADNHSIAQQNALGDATARVAVVHGGISLKRATVSQIKCGIDFGYQRFVGRPGASGTKYQKRIFMAVQSAARVIEFLQQRLHGVEITQHIAAVLRSRPALCIPRAHRHQLPAQIEFRHLYSRMLEFGLPGVGVAGRQCQRVDPASAQEASAPVHRQPDLRGAQVFVCAHAHAQFAAPARYADDVTIGQRARAQVHRVH